MACTLACCAPGCRGAGPGAALVVDVAWPGASAAEVDAQLAPAIERALAGVEDVDDAGMLCRASGGALRVAAPLRRWTARATSDAVRALADVALPAGAAPPVVVLDSADRRPVARYAVRADALSLAEATRARDQVAEALRTVSGVVEVRTSGGVRREIQVRVDGARARAFGLTAADVASVLRNAPLPDLAAVEQVALRKAPAPVLLRDVATVEDGARPLDAAPPATLALEVVKYPGARTRPEVVGAAVTAALHAHALPPGVALVPQPLDDVITVALVLPGAAFSGAVPEAVRDAGFDVQAPPLDDMQRTVVIDDARAAALGVVPADASLALRFALAGVEAGRLTGAEGPPLRVSQPIDEHEPLGEQLHVATRTGELVALARVAEERLSSSPSTLLRLAGARAVLLCARRVAPQAEAPSDTVAAARRAAPGAALVDAGPLARALCRP